jgi:hypothetical protein
MKQSGRVLCALVGFALCAVAGAWENSFIIPLAFGVIGTYLFLFKSGLIYRF